MHSVPISLFLVLFVQTAIGEPSLPSPPEAVQLLQLETIRGLEQTILEKEDENRRLEEIIQSVKMEMLQSYNQLAEMIENMKTAMEKEGQVETSELLIHLADLRSALDSARINMDTLEQQAKMIVMQGRSIDLLTPLLHRSNSSDILWFENTSRSTGEVGVSDVAACSCLPRSASTNQLRPVKIDYQCQGDTNRSFQLFCPGGVCSSRELPSCTESLEWEEEEVGFEKCQELSFNGAFVFCGENFTKKTTKRLHSGGGIVEEVVFTTPCNCAALAGTYVLVSYDENYRTYLEAMDIPWYVVPIILASKEKFSITELGDDTVQILTETSIASRNMTFKFGEEFSMEYGKGMGIMWSVCTREAPNAMMCRSEERERNWKLESKMIVSEEGIVNERTFVNKNITAKKFYKRKVEQVEEEEEGEEEEEEASIVGEWKNEDWIPIWNDDGWEEDPSWGEDDDDW